MRPLLAGSLLLGVLVSPAAFTAPPSGAQAENPPSCEAIYRARVALTADQRPYLNRIEDTQRAVHARTARHQIEASLLRVELRRQLRAGQALSQEQKREMNAADQRVKQSAALTPEEQDKIAVAKQTMRGLEEQYQRQHGSAWTECPRYEPRQSAEADSAAGAYAVAQGTQQTPR